MPALTIKAILMNLVPVFCIFILMAVLLLCCYRKPSQGQALIRNGLGGMVVSFSGTIVLPFLHKADWLDITLKRIVMEETLTCQDGTAVQIKAAFFVRTNPTVSDVMRVVKTLGIGKASDVEALSELFGDRFVEALETVSKAYDYETLTDREMFKENVKVAAGTELDGYVLDTVTIDYLEKTETA